MNYTKTVQGCPDQVYQGFSGVQPDAEVIAIALFDGDSDLYAVDPTAIEQAKAEINRYYKEGYDRGPDKLTVYRREDAK